MVHVRNGSGTNGLAGQVLERLAGLGFVRGTVDNTAEIEEWCVRHRDSDDAAEAVAEQLGGFAVEQDDSVPSGHLQVVLGADAPAKIPGLPRPGRRHGRGRDHRGGRALRRLTGGTDERPLVG